MSIKAIVTDIEGTTTSIAFVHDVLFPYAKKHLADYVAKHYHNHVDLWQDIATITQQDNLSQQQVIDILLEWIHQDKKITPLKTLQGFIWQAGYQQGDLKGHIYLDAMQQLQKWHDAGIKLYIYSSGAVQAQKLLFGHTDYGDLTPWFSGYFDTHIGGKKETSSYQKIAHQIGQKAHHILFLSDMVDEITAALQADYHVCHLDREQQHAPQDSYPTVSNFTTIDDVIRF